MRRSRRLMWVAVAGPGWGSAGPAAAQSSSTSSSPTLAELLKNVYGPHGMIVDSQNVLPDGSTHSAFFRRVPIRVRAFQHHARSTADRAAGAVALLRLHLPVRRLNRHVCPDDTEFRTHSCRPRRDGGRGTSSSGTASGSSTFMRSTDLASLISRPSSGTTRPLGRRPRRHHHDPERFPGLVTQSTTFLTFGATDRLDISLAVPMVRTF